VRGRPWVSVSTALLGLMFLRLSRSPTRRPDRQNSASKEWDTKDPELERPTMRGHEGLRVLELLDQCHDHDEPTRKRCEDSAQDQECLNGVCSVRVRARVRHET